MQEDCETLISLFVADTSDAIEQSKLIISFVSNFDTYKEFCEYHRNHARISTCQKEWSTPRMSIHCIDCSINDSSCMCLECFLNSNHEGHDYIIQPNVVGNCDCGDTSLLKRQGFCQKHQGLDDEKFHPQDYLDEKLRTTLTDYVFKSAFSALKILSSRNDSNSVLIILFISTFLQFGDGFRRLIAISLTEKIDFKDLMRNITRYDYQFNQSLQQLCGKLINDFVFKNNFSRVIYEIIIDDILTKDFDALISKINNRNYSIWSSFWFHSFSSQLIQYNIEHFEWDWVSFTLKFCKLLKKSFSFINNESYNYHYPHSIAEIITSLPSCSKLQPNEQTQLFFDKLFSEVLNCGTEESKNNSIISASFKDDKDERYYVPIFHFNMHFYYIIKCFKNKKNLKLETFIDELDDKINISPIYSIGNNENENDNYKFIQNYIKDEYEDEDKVDFSKNNPKYYYRSFHNGSSLFITHPLYDSLVHMFRLDNFCRVKIARLLSMERYQNLRVRLALVTMKSLLGFICFHESIVPKNNHGLILYVRYFVNNPTVISSGIPLYFPVLQMLIGLQCNKIINVDIKNKSSSSTDEDECIYGNDNADVVGNDEEFGLKEFFAYEMAREIGVFDDYTKVDYDDENVIEQQKQMMFSFLYYSILLVIERDLFNYDENTFLKEQLIFALKQGSSTIDELNKSFDHKNNCGERKLLFPISLLLTIANTRKSSSSSNSSSNSSSSNSSSIKLEDEEIKYVLKDGIEWKTISAINTLNIQKTLLNNEIVKHEDSLLKIPNFEPEESFFFHSIKSDQTSTTSNESDESINDYDIDSSDLHIRLKDFIFTPTVLAIVYHTLRTNTGIDSPNVELNDHLAMNILLLISKFINEKEESSRPSSSSIHSSLFNKSTTIEYNTIPELISCFKKIIFNYHIDENEKTFIQNTINSDVFDTFLRVKISYNDKEPKSIIDILLNKGKIGKIVLDRLSIVIENNDDEDSKQDRKLIMKERARKIKEQVMCHFQDLISNFKIDENDDDLNSQDENDDFENDENCLDHSNKDTCSICSINRPNEILTYPIYIYYTKIPFIFDKPLFLLKREVNSEVDENSLFEEEIDEEKKKEDKRIEDDKISIQNELIGQLSDLWKDVQSRSKLLIIRFLQDEVTCRISRNGRCISSDFQGISNNRLRNNNNNNNNNNNEDSETSGNANNNESDDDENEHENRNESDTNSNNNDDDEIAENSQNSNNNNSNNNNEDSEVSENANNNENENDDDDDDEDGANRNLDDDEDGANRNLDDDDDANRNLDDDEDGANRNLDDDDDANRNLDDDEDGANRNLDDENGVDNESDSENDIDIEYNKNNENDANKEKYPGTNFFIQFGICQHFVHSDCVNRKGFKCPIDRSMKNGFLPSLDDFSKNFLSKVQPNEINASNLPFEVVQSVSLFITIVYRIFYSYDKWKCDVFVELVKSISGIITTHEVRVRTLPRCLDSKKTKILARNLFLTTWYGFRILGKPIMLDLNRQRKITLPSYYPIEIDSKLSLFQKFIKKLIESDVIEINKNEELNRIVDEFINSQEFNLESLDSPLKLNRKKKELCLFLRRVCLADYFLLGNDNFPDFVDWNVILSPEKLFERYNINFLQVNDDEFHFKPFTFSELPEQFIKFSLKPYCFPVDLTQDLIYFNLINNKHLIENFDDFDDFDENAKAQKTEEDEKKKFEKQINIFGEQSATNEKYLLLTNFCIKKSPTVLLYVGKEASKVIVIYQGYKVSLKPFYSDKNGSPDIGYHRNQPLYLNNERLKRFTDEILSGDFTNYLEPLIRL